jgi:hypothetical protein
MRKGIIPGCAFLLLLAGCGTKGDNAELRVYPVSGTVTLPNGQPVRGARILFTAKLGTPNPGGSDAFAEIDSQGNFKLQTMDNRDGAMPGMYKVMIQPATNNPRVSKDDLSYARQNIPKTYWSDDTTTLEADVKPEPNTFTFKLK